MGSQLSSNNHLIGNPIETRTYLLANHSSKEISDAPPPKINKNDEGDNPKTASANIVLAESDIVDYSRDTKFKNKEILESLANDLLNVIGRLNEIQETTESNSFSTIQSELNCVHTKLVDRAMDEKTRKLRGNKSCLKNIYTGQLIDCDLRTLRSKVGSHEYPKVILNQTFGDKHGNNPIREGMVVSLCGTVEPLPPCEQNAVYYNNIREAPVMANEPAIPFVNHINQYSVQSGRTISPNNVPLQRSNPIPRRLTLTGSGHYLNINQQDKNQAPRPAIINTSLQTSENQVEMNNDTNSVFDPQFNSTVIGTIIDQVPFPTSIEQSGQSGYVMTNKSVPQTHNQRNNIMTATGPAEYAQRQNQTNNFSVPADIIEQSQRQNRTNHAHLIAIGSAKYVERQNETNNVPIESCPMNRSQGQNQRNDLPKATASMKQSQRQNQTNNVPMAACLINQSQYKNQTNNIPIESGPMNRSQRKNQRKIKQSQRQNQTDNVTMSEHKNQTKNIPIEASPMNQYNIPIATVSMNQSQRHNQTDNVPMAACPINQSHYKNETNNIPIEACPMNQSPRQSQRNNVPISVKQSQRQNQTDKVPMAACPMNQSQHKNETKYIPIEACPMNQSQYHNQTNNVPIATVSMNQSQYKNETKNIPIEACPMNQSQHKNETKYIPIEACPMNQSQHHNQTNNVPIATVSMNQSQYKNETKNIPIEACPMNQSQHKNETKYIPIEACPMNQSQHHNQTNNVPIATVSMNQPQHKNETKNIPIEACPMNQSQHHNQTNNVPIATDSMEQSIAEELHNSNQTLAIYDLIKQASQTIPFNVAAVENFFNVIGGLKGRLSWKNLLLVVVENIRTFTAVKIFNKLTFQEVGHFNLTALEMRSVYESGLLELFQYIKNLNTLQNPYAIDQFTPSTIQLILEEKDSKQSFLPTNKSFADLQYYQNSSFEPQSYIDFSGINRAASLK